MLILKGLSWLLMARFTAYSRADVAQLWPRSFGKRSMFCREMGRRHGWSASRPRHPFSLTISLFRDETMEVARHCDFALLAEDQSSDI